MTSKQVSGIYVRPVQPTEYQEAARVLTRAFARDPAMNWYGCVKKAVPRYDSKEPRALRTLKRLYDFQLALLKATVLLGGLVIVAVVPLDTTLEGKDQKKQEKIAGVVLWLKPGQTLDIGLCTLLRSGFHKVLLGWGIEGMKRLTVEFSPAVEHALEKTFKARQLDRLDSWHLLTIVVDPEHEGNGLCSLMMKDGFARTAPKPVHLEATTSKSRDIYARYGFEIDEEHRYGKGKVDSNGLKARGDAATGYPEWIMTKWSY